MPDITDDGNHMSSTRSPSRTLQADPKGDRTSSSSRASRGRPRSTSRAASSRAYLTWFTILTIAITVGVGRGHRHPAAEPRADPRDGQLVHGRGCRASICRSSTLLQQSIDAGTATATAEQARQLELLSGFNAARAQSLAIISTIGVILTMLIQPIVGVFADRTRTQVGPPRAVDPVRHRRRLAAARADALRTVDRGPRDRVHARAGGAEHRERSAGDDGRRPDAGEPAWRRLGPRRLRQLLRRPARRSARRRAVRRASAWTSTSSSPRSSRSRASCS